VQTLWKKLYLKGNQIMGNGIFNTPKPVNEPVLSYREGSPEKTSLRSTLKSFEAICSEIPLAIAGKPGKGQETSPIICPHNRHKVIANAQHATREDVEQAISSCLRSRDEWANLPWQERAAVFLKAADLFATKYRPIINATTMLGQSKTCHQAEIDAACELIDFFKFNAHYAQRIYEEQPTSSPGVWNRTESRALEGFVFAVTPFNFTSIAINLATAPALMGCSVLWKPAGTSMLACHIALQVLREAGLPDGVINMVYGDHQMIGEVALQSPQLSGLHFTGSTGTFNYLWKSIGQNIDNYNQYPRIVGETGGKDFVFVHESAAIDEVSTALIRGSFEYQGQKCSASSRAYVPKSMWPRLKEQLADLANSIQIGNPADFRNFMGAVIDQRSFDRIKGYIDHAKTSSDARIIAGGECDDSEGFFIRPTIIEALDPHYQSMVEEIFGPVLTVYPYDDDKLDETLKICDQSTRYALTGAIFAKDRHVIQRLSRALTNAAGNFYVNDKPTGAVVGQQPFGGARASGTNDKAGSMYNLIRWTSVRTIKENMIPVTDYKYPFMSAE
jgi:1-pyrroline-5-carboxylate dehydrogenase